MHTFEVEASQTDAMQTQPNNFFTVLLAGCFRNDTVENHTSSLHWLQGRVWDFYWGMLRSSVEAIVCQIKKDTDV